MKNQTDKDIQSFFDQMKEKDGRMHVPDFPKPVLKSSMNWWIPLGIAASLTLGLLIWPQEEAIPDPPADVIIITLKAGENNKQQLLIEEKTFLETWESPTSSLLTDF